MLSDEALETFSYAAPDDPQLKRFIIRLIEKMSGQPYLKWLYEDHLNNPVPGETFWEAAVKRLELRIVANEDELAALPKTGPLVVVSNHPFGVLDGVVLCHLVERVRKDFRVLINSVLYRAEEARPYLLPIDFAETDDAMKTNLKSRAAPFYFAGQNSRLFQLASHISMTLRLSLLFKEVHDRIGSEIHVRVGNVAPYDKLGSTTDRHEFMDNLRRMTYALGNNLPAIPKTRVKRPKRAPRDKPIIKSP